MMSKSWSRIRVFGITLAGFALVCVTLQATAEEGSVLVEETAAPAVAPAPAEAPAPVAAQPAAYDVVAEEPAADCCPEPCISYRTHLSAKRMLRCKDQVEVTVVVDNPADCVECPVDVPLCIPACCEGEPCETSSCGLLGRGKVEFCWPCGFSATVVFRAGGDIVVHYRG